MEVESSDQSDIEISSALLKTKQTMALPKSPIEELLKEAKKLSTKKVPKKTKKLPKTQPTEDLQKEAKKLSTKEMIIKALSESKSRKGISLYVIKKYMHDTFSVDTEKINYIIKKSIKDSVEAGVIVQTKGIGASGSFRLAPGSKQPKKPSKKTKTPKETSEANDNMEKPKKSSLKTADGDAKPKKKVAKNVTISKTSKAVDKETKKPKSVKEKSLKDNPKPGTSGMRTPKKKGNNMMKRKSIGSIIKPPKMKPRAQVK